VGDHRGDAVNVRTPISLIPLVPVLACLAACGATPSETLDGSLDAGPMDGGGDAGGSPAPGYAFADVAYDDYVQVDRMGYPGANMVFNAYGDKDAYNQGSPVDDADQVFLDDVRLSLGTWLEGAPMEQVADNTGLADDLSTLGVMTCEGPPELQCLSYIGPLAIPDVIALDLDEPPSPLTNGRPVGSTIMDVLLAITWLDLETHDLTTFYDLDGDGLPGPSLNPRENDVPLPTTFPYLAPAHVVPPIAASTD
jgi:hypothetical protein